ncbi:MAG: flavin-containing monooxygenase, partial [Sphingomonadaceae bacterium]
MEQAEMQAGQEQILDVAIIGAGISGIGMAAHMGIACPHLGYTILEQREHLGGTWDVFRYPGVRSDSDMQTLGFGFEPWVDEKSIADGDAILRYLHKIVDERAISPHIRYQHMVRCASFDSATALWTIDVETPEGAQTIHARFLFLGSGYYDYDSPYNPGFAGSDSFAGRIVHPQFWPEDLDYTGKNVVVIGSGATAVTLVPAMTGKAAHVTMLQRTPTWMGARPSRDGFANSLRKVLPEKLAYRITRAKNIWLHQYIFKRARTQPDKVGQYLTDKAKAALGPVWNE